MDWSFGILMLGIGYLIGRGVGIYLDSIPEKKPLRLAWRNKHNGFICVTNTPFPSGDYERVPYLDQEEE